MNVYSHISIGTQVEGIRRLRAKDIPLLQKILRESPFFNNTERREVVKQIREYFFYPEGDAFRTYVYRRGKEIAGFICFGTDLGEDTYEISFLFVSPKYQRNGIGSKLLRFVEKYVRSNKGRIIFLYTSSSREYVPAQRLYQKNGYVKSAVIRDYFDDGDSKIIYAKRLRKNRTPLSPISSMA